MLGNVDLHDLDLNSPAHGVSTKTSFDPTLATHCAHAPPQRFLSCGDYRLLPVSIETKALFDHYAQRHASPLADLSFSNNFIWFTHMSGFYQLVDDCFCLFGLRGNRLGMLLPPIGEPGRQFAALQSCFAVMDSYNPTPDCSQVEFVGPELARALSGELWLLEPAFPDYLYRTDDLIELRGNAYKTKRGEINQFLRSYPNYRIEPLGPHHWPGIRALLAEWLCRRIQGLSGAELAEFVASAELERLGIDRALQFYDRLGLSGLCLIIDGRIEGFTFGERLNGEVASVLVEKTNFDIVGAAQYLFREFARTFADCRYLNVGDDLGLENLRRVKMSYRPVAFVEKFTLRRAST